jgi:hypothetical protein
MKTIEMNRFVSANATHCIRFGKLIILAANCSFTLTFEDLCFSENYSVKREEFFNLKS